MQSATSDKTRTPRGLQWTGRPEKTTRLSLLSLPGSQQKVHGCCVLLFFAIGPLLLFIPQCQCQCQCQCSVSVSAVSVSVSVSGGFFCAQICLGSLSLLILGTLSWCISFLSYHLHLRIFIFRWSSNLVVFINGASSPISFFAGEESLG